MEKHSKFVRILITLLAIFIATLIAISFIWGEPKFQLTAELISLILIILVLFLSESFNNLSIGKLLTLSKENKVKQNENTGLKKENLDLRGQLISLATNVNQSQVTYNGLSPEFLKSLNVVPAGENEKDLGNDSEQAPFESCSQKSSQASESELKSASSPKTSQIRLTKILKPDAIANFCRTIGINSEEIRHNVRFASAFEGLDPIMESSVIFDAYYQLEDKEIFFEAMRIDMLRPDRFYYLYQMLTKLYLYNKAKGGNAELILLIVDIPNEVKSKMGWGERNKERLLSQFAPAVGNKLLRIENIKYTDDELTALIDKNKIDSP